MENVNIEFDFKMLVSIIITAYNCECYIDECIASVVRQTYSKIEVIVINDGSKDGTWNKIKEWTTKDSRIIAINSENCGVVAARKTALEQAKGDFLTFVDSDDYLPDDAIEKLFLAIRKNDADIVVGSYTLTWQKKKIFTKVCNAKNFDNSKECMEYCLKNGETFIPIKMYKTALFRSSVNIPENINIQEDTIGVIQYLKSADKAAYCNDSVYYYRKYEGTASSTFSEKHRRSLINVSVLLRELLPAESYPSLQYYVDLITIGNIFSCLEHNGANKDNSICCAILSKIDWKRLKLTDYQMSLKACSCYLYSNNTLLGRISIVLAAFIIKSISIIRKYMGTVYRLIRS